MSLICFYNSATHPVDKGKTLEDACLDFGKAFDAVSYSIILDNFAWTCVLFIGLKIVQMVNTFIDDLDEGIVCIHNCNTP